MGIHLRKIMCLSLVAAMVFIWAGYAAAAPAIPENPGAVREKIERNQAGTDIKNVAPVPEKAGSSASFKLNKLTIKLEKGLKGKSKELDKIAAKYQGKAVTLNDLNDAAMEVTRYFRAHGYPAATAYLPEQKTKTGDITIKVAPGRFGTITIDNKSQVKDSAIKRLTKGIKKGKVVKGKTLETALYNIIGLGGVKAGGLLQPGNANGESNLTIKVENSKAETQVLYANNHGSRAAGRYRYGITADWYEMAGAGDHLGVNGMVSNARQKNVGIRYDQSVGHSGTRLGAGVSYGNYELGANAAALGAKGTATTYSLYGNTPLFHTSKEALNVTYGVDYRDMTDKLNSFNYRMDKKSYNAHVGLSGMKKSGMNTTISYDLTGYAGHINGDYKLAGIKGKLNQAGGFSKGTANFTLVHKFAPQWDVLVKASAQVAGCDLDSSEEMYLGGAAGVRAYPQGEGSGDKGFTGTAELRYHVKNAPGLVLSSYLDAGRVRSKDAPDTRNTTLKGWGIGVTYARDNDYFVRLDYARRIGLGDNTSNDARAKQRIWFILGKVL